MRPDTVCVAVSRVDGGLTVMRVVVKEYAPDGSVVREVEPTAERIEAVIAKHNWQGGMAAVSWRIVPGDFITEETDLSYRNAWKDEGGDGPGHDMVKARDLHRDRLRRDRTKLLDELDIQYQKADEQNDQQRKREIAQEKQRLRDLPADPRIDAAKTIQELTQIEVTNGN